MDHTAQMVLSTAILSLLLLGCIFSATLTAMSDPWQRPVAAGALGTGTLVTVAGQLTAVVAGIPLGTTLLNAALPLSIAAAGAILLLRQIPGTDPQAAMLTLEDLPPIPPTTPGLRTGLGLGLSRCLDAVTPTASPGPSGDCGDPVKTADAGSRTKPVLRDIMRSHVAPRPHDRV